VLVLVSEHKKVFAFCSREKEISPCRQGEGTGTITRSARGKGNARGRGRQMTESRMERDAA
jgi:hypothetical protein